MKSASLLALQSLSHGLQVVNVAIAATSTLHTPPWLPIIISALCAALGYFCQNAGNELQPEPTEQKSKAANG